LIGEVPVRSGSWLLSKAVSRPRPTRRRRTGRPAPSPVTCWSRCRCRARAVSRRAWWPYWSPSPPTSWSRWPRRSPPSWPARRRWWPRRRTPGPIQATRSSCWRPTAGPGSRPTARTRWATGGKRMCGRCSPRSGCSWRARWSRSRRASGNSCAQSRPATSASAISCSPPPSSWRESRSCSRSGRPSPRPSRCSAISSSTCSPPPTRRCVPCSLRTPPPWSAWPSRPPGSGCTSWPVRPFPTPWARSWSACCSASSRSSWSTGTGASWSARKPIPGSAPPPSGPCSPRRKSPGWPTCGWRWSARGWSSWPATWTSPAMTQNRGWPTGCAPWRRGSARRPRSWARCWACRPL